MRQIHALKAAVMLAVLMILLTSRASSSQETQKVKLIISIGIESFVNDLNDNGKLGYRLENSLSYAGEGPTQNYAAILRLDAQVKDFFYAGGLRVILEK